MYRYLKKKFAAEHSNSTQSLKMATSKEHGPSTSVDDVSHCVQGLRSIKMQDPDEDNDEITVKVNPLTHKPNEVYENLSVSKKWKQTFKEVEPMDRNMPKNEGFIRFVCISDTHSKHKSLLDNLPEGDVLLHAGDFTFEGSRNEITEFCSFLTIIKPLYKHIVVIAGNHELTFDQMLMNGGGFSAERGDQDATEEFKDILRKHCIYLEDEETELYGIKIYGTPWQPRHRGWAFNVPRGEPLLKIWNKIPDDTDILLCHGPPLGHGDFSKHNVRAGCVELLATIQDRVKPKYAVFGHIHEAQNEKKHSKTYFPDAGLKLAGRFLRAEANCRTFWKMLVSSSLSSAAHEPASA
eukprot:gene455-1097_t